MRCAAVLAPGYILVYRGTRYGIIIHNYAGTPVRVPYQGLSMKVVGLTGGIACGKSAVSASLRAQNLVVIDLDELARRVVRPGRRAYRQIVRTFGAVVVRSDGTLDREAVGRRIFSNRNDRRAVSRATHAPIMWELLRDLTVARAAGIQLPGGCS